VQRDDQELEVLRGQVGQRAAEVARYEGLLRERELLEHQLQAAVGERDKRLEELSGLIQERDAQLAQLQTNIERLKRTLQEKEALLNGIYQSTSWKVTAPARQISSLFRRTP
jgi:hypothetical protein